MRYAWLAVVGVVMSVLVGMESGARGQTQSDLAAARGERAKAEAGYNLLVKKLRTDFEATSEYQTALAQEQAAEENVSCARQAVLDGLAKDAGYAGAKGAQARAQAELEGAKASGDQEAVFKASKAKMDSAAALAKVENAALDKDTAYTAAQQALDVAREKLAALLKTFDESTKKNDEVAAARKTLDDAIAKQKQVEASANATAAAAARDAAARAQAARAVQPSAPRPAAPVMRRPGY